MISVSECIDLLVHYNFLLFCGAMGYKTLGSLRPLITSIVPYIRIMLTFIKNGSILESYPSVAWALIHKLIGIFHLSSQIDIEKKKMELFPCSLTHPIIQPVEIGKNKINEEEKEWCKEKEEEEEVTSVSERNTLIV